MFPLYLWYQRTSVTPAHALSLDIGPDVIELPVQVIEHPGRGVEAAGAREVRVSTLEEALDVLRAGSQHLITSATLMNQASSRSHSIFMLRLDQVPIFVGTNRCQAF